MGILTIAEICDAIDTTLGAATGISRSQSYDELTEGVHAGDLPLLQIYPDSGEADIESGTDRSTFRAGIRQTQFIIVADLYARQRSHIGEDMHALVDSIDAIIAVLEAQDTKDYFGQDGIQAFRWRFERVTFMYGDPQIPYVGARFYLTIRVF